MARTMARTMARIIRGAGYRARVQGVLLIKGPGYRARVQGILLIRGAPATTPQASPYPQSGVRPPAPTTRTSTPDPQSSQLAKGYLHLQRGAPHPHASGSCLGGALARESLPSRQVQSCTPTAERERRLQAAWAGAQAGYVIRG